MGKGEEIIPKGLQVKIGNGKSHQDYSRRQSVGEGSPSSHFIIELLRSAPTTPVSSSPERVNVDPKSFSPRSDSTGSLCSNASSDGSGDSRSHSPSPRRKGTISGKETSSPREANKKRPRVKVPLFKETLLVTDLVDMTSFTTVCQGNLKDYASYWVEKASLSFITYLYPRGFFLYEDNGSIFAFVLHNNYRESLGNTVSEKPSSGETINLTKHANKPQEKAQLNTIKAEKLGPLKETFQNFLRDFIFPLCSQKPYREETQEKGKMQQALTMALKDKRNASREGSSAITKLSIISSKEELLKLSKERIKDKPSFIYSKELFHMAMEEIAAPESLKAACKDYEAIKNIVPERLIISCKDDSKTEKTPQESVKALYEFDEKLKEVEEELAKKKQKIFKRITRIFEHETLLGKGDYTSIYYARQALMEIFRQWQRDDAFVPIEMVPAFANHFDYAWVDGTYTQTVTSDGVSRFLGEVAYHKGIEKNCFTGVVIIMTTTGIEEYKLVDHLIEERKSYVELKDTLSLPDRVATEENKVMNPLFHPR